MDCENTRDANRCFQVTQRCTSDLRFKSPLLSMGSYETTTLTILNFTNQTDTDLHESPTVTQRVKDILLEPLNIVMIIISITGLFANALSIAATLHIPHSQTAHSKLIISLAVSDICIIFTVFCYVLQEVLSPLHDSTLCVEVANQAIMDFSLLAIILNLLAMGIDHYIAIIKPMHYHQIMSRFRGNVMILGIWIISLTGGLLDIIVGAAMESKKYEDFCSNVQDDEFPAMLLMLGLIPLELLVLGYIYLRIFFEVRLLLKRGATLHQDDMHNKKAIVTMLLIIGTFMVCLVPNSIFQITVYVMVHTDKQRLLNSLETILSIHNILWILMLSNSLCDPIIYALRLNDVQHGYRRLLKKFCKGHISSTGYGSQYNSRRNTVRISVSDSEINQEFSAETTLKGNVTNPFQSDSNESNEVKDTERDHLLINNNKNCKSPTDRDTKKQLFTCMLVNDNKERDVYSDDTMSEMTILTPTSLTSDKLFLQNE